jgi:hypothetical protein
VLVVAVVIVAGGAFILSNLGEASPAGPDSAPPDWASYEGLAAFCEQYEDYWVTYEEPLRARFDDESMTEAQAFSEMLNVSGEVRRAWRGIGFPDEKVGEARSVDEMLGVFDGLNRVEIATFEQLESDSELGDIVDAGNIAYEDIRMYARDRCF